MANQNKKMSFDGLASLYSRERLKKHYYSDQANNCTYGVGTLVHYGPCTSEELKIEVTMTQINTSLAQAVFDAENTVRRNVYRNELSQNQFDALVSFVYNVGGQASRPVLVTANEGNYARVASQMMEYVYIHPHKNGHRLPAVMSHGLVNRRREEAKPFKVNSGSAAK